MIDPTVRPANTADVDALAELEHEARVALADVRGGERWLATHPAHDTRWPATLTDHVVHVAHIDGVVVGFAIAQFDDAVAHLESVYVTPLAREVGFGDALLEATLAAARSSGCAVIEGNALPGDRDTKNLFERAGITARLIIVSRRLT